MNFTDPSHQSPESSRARTLTLLSLLVALGPCTVDLYVPALPALRADLHATTAAAQLTLTATTIGIAVGQLIVGPWSDSVGRRRPLLFSTALHVMGSLGVAAAPAVEVMLLCRFVQGVGAAGTGVVAVAIVRDLFDETRFVRASARLAAVTGLAPVAAPFLGSLLLGLVAWRGLFVVVAAYGLAALVLSARLLPESRPARAMVAGGSPGAAERYRVLFADGRFVGAALISGMIVSAVFTYMTSSSFLFQGVYRLSPQAYSIVFAANAVGFVVGSQCCSRVLRRHQPTRVLSFTLPVLTAVGVGIAVATSGSTSPSPLTVLTAVFFIFAGASGPCLQLVAMAPHSLRAGSAAAALGAVSFGMAGITAPLAGVLGGASARPTGLVMALTMALAMGVFVALVRPARTRSPDARLGRPKEGFADLLLRPSSTFRDEVVEAMQRG
jgi:DHA1 family bicyclomycin/chloramphenicol resistance-like MFS transporter